MEITSVKIQGQGYLLNGNMTVPMAHGNREYELIKQWLKDNTPEPEFTDAELAQQGRDKAIAEANTEIARLESAQQRPLRELLLDANNQYAKNKITEIEALIQAQRDIIKTNL